jgi:probable FeS assembly SUF system protein SufT
MSMATREARTLARDVEVTAIPYGDRIPLAAGTTVYITQSLGGSYTLFTDMGYMVRLDNQDADAIGEEPQAPPSAEELAGRSTLDLCWDQLKTCYDPEIPVNIVDLGLVYGCELEPVEGREGQRVKVRFTLTAPGCGMGDVLRQDIERKLLGVPGIDEAQVEVVLDPPWSQEMMSDAARLQLGLM